MLKGQFCEVWSFFYLDKHQKSEFNLHFEDSNIFLPDILAAYCVETVKIAVIHVTTHSCKHGDNKRRIVFTVFGLCEKRC